MHISGYLTHFDAGINSQSAKEKFTALHLAAQHGQLPVMEYVSSS